MVHISAPRTESANSCSLLDVGGGETTLLLLSREVNTPGTPGHGVWPRPRVCVMAVDTQFIVVIEMRALSPVHSLLWSNCVLQRAAASLCDDALMMALKVLRLRSSGQMREVNTHGAAGRGVWFRPSVCVRAIGTRCRRGVNAEVENSASHAWVCKGCGQTDLHLPKYSVLQTEN